MTSEEQNLELKLTNAFVAVETYQAARALSFLEDVDPASLSTELKIQYYSITGQALVLLKKYEAGRPALQQALQLLEADPQSTALQIERVRNWIGISHYEQGDYLKARDYHFKCVQALSSGKIAESRFSLKIYLNLGNDYLMLGEDANALEMFRTALKSIDGKHDRDDLAALYWAIGLAYRSIKNLERAKLYLKKSADLYRQLDELSLSAKARNLLGLVLCERGEYEAARHALEEALAIAENLNDAETLASASTNLALMWFKWGDKIEAEKAGEAALAYTRQLDNYHLMLGQAQAQLAEIKFSLGKPDEAFELYEQAITNIKQTGSIDIIQEIYYRYSLRLKSSGRSARAYDVLVEGYLQRTNLSRNLKLGFDSTTG